MATPTSVSRVAGLIEIRVDGQLLKAAGEFSYNPGKPKREMMVGHDQGVHGTKETPQVPFIEGDIRHTPDLNQDTLVTITNATVTLTLPNRKIKVLRNADYCGEGTGSTGEGTIPARFEGRSMDEI